MEKTEQAQLKAQNKSYVGIVGFVLGVAGIISCGLTALPGLVLCVIGVILKGHRILSSLGLIICLIVFASFSVWTPPGSIPYPFSVAKYCMTARAFWVGYDIRHLREAQSQYLLFGGAEGSLFFKAKLPNTYKENEIIEFASEHDWDYVDRVQFGEKDFQGLLNEEDQVKRFDYETNYNNHIRDYEQEAEAIQAFQAFQKRSEFLDNVTVGSQFPLWIRENCTILSFDTGNRINCLSYAVINSNGTKMAIYYNGAR